VPVSGDQRARFTQIHHFETITGAVWKRTVHHLRRMTRQLCQKPSRRMPYDAVDLTFAIVFRCVIVATINFKTALETDVCS